jgi:Skp family chaperone for outer membrane proteins
MSNPEDKAATPVESAVDVQTQVSSIVSNITSDDEGNYIFPEDVELTPELKFAATAEKRRRDTQTSYTKNQQALKALEAEKASLLEQLSNSNKPSFTAEEQEELDNLMYEDPQAWRQKVNQLESQKLNESRAKLEELTGEARRAAEQTYELERRSQVLQEFNDSTSTPISAETIANEVPPRITRKLEEGKISFEDFLQEVHTYINKGKVVENPSTINQPNMGNLGGGVTPKDMKPEKSLSESYKNDIF